MVDRAIRGPLNDPASVFAVGDRVFFQQTTPSVGWTKESSSTYDDAGIRLQTGTVVTGGTDAWSVTHSSSKATDSHVLTIAEMPSHNHTGTYATISGSGVTGLSQRSDTTGVTENVVAQGGGGGHTHTMQTDLKFAECSIGIRD